MKKILTVLLATTLIGVATTNAQVYLQGGLNIANISTSDDGQTQKSNAIGSFNDSELGSLYSSVKGVCYWCGICTKDKGRR